MQIIILQKYHTSRVFVSQIPKIFDTDGETIYQGRNTVKRFMNGCDEWIVKRYKRPNLIQRIVYTFFKKSKAERAYLYAQTLQAKGIGTPDGIAFIEEKKYGLIRDCYFISTACNYPTVYPTLGKDNHFDLHFADSLAAFFVQLHEKGFLHGDPNLNNFLFHKDKEGNYQFVVIDTNRSVFKPSPTRQECLYNLMKVTHNRELLQYITRQYAIRMEWDVEECVNTVMKALDKFERRYKIKQLIKGKNFIHPLTSKH